jgi:hypothetical protein
MGGEGLALSRECGNQVLLHLDVSSLKVSSITKFEG